MRKTIWVAAFAIGLAAVAVAGSKVPVLDGSSWKVDVEPDKMAKEKGEKDFKDTLTFADGKVSMSECLKVACDPWIYTLAQSGEKDLTFKTERDSDTQGASVWTGMIHGNNIEGKLVWTKLDGAVLTYSFKGSKLD